MPKVKLDASKCLGCGACVDIAPKNFDFDDEGLSTLISEEVNEQAIEAAEACPVSAIEIGCCGHCHDEHECECDDDCECGCKDE